MALTKSLSPLISDAIPVLPLLLLPLLLVIPVSLSFTNFFALVTPADANRTICTSGTAEAMALLVASPFEYSGHKHINKGALPLWMIFLDNLVSIFPFLANVIQICNHAVAPPIATQLDKRSCVNGASDRRVEEEIMSRLNDFN